MRLDPSYLCYMTKDEFRMLTAVEIGMKNHEYVPMHLIERISHLKRACAYKVIRQLLKNKLVHHQNKSYDGYKLTYLGYDYLALQVFMKRGHIKDVIGKIGCGKESDIYKCTNENGDYVILKFTRLGRTSFRTIKNNRDYIQHRTSYNWLYLSRLSAIKEFSFMDLLYKNQFPTPTPIDQNRHGIVMSLIEGQNLQNIPEVNEPQKVFEQCMDLIKRLAENGLIHSDFNEFNLMIQENEKIIMIDFPQMVSTMHKNAEFYFNRDVECIHVFFERRFNYQSKYTLDFNKINKINDLDIQVKASGFVKKEIKNIDDFDIDLRESDNESGQENESGEENESNNEKDNSKDDNELNSEGEEEKGESSNEQKDNSQEQEDQVNEKEEEQKNEHQEALDNISGISADDLNELNNNNQELFSDDDEQHKKQQKKQKKVKNNIEIKQDLKNIQINEQDLVEKAKAFIQKQQQKQFKQKLKIQKQTIKKKEKINVGDY